MNALEIDVDGRRPPGSRPGSRPAEYTVATGERGRVTGFGDAGSVGIGGITLAGGIGFLIRKNGLTIDDLLAAEVVTADGELVEASEDRARPVLGDPRRRVGTSASPPASSCGCTRSRRSSAG